MNLKRLKDLFRILTAFLYLPHRVLKKLYMEGLRFVYDTRGEAGDFTAPVMIVIAGIIWVIMTPILADTVIQTNTTSWNFTGYQGAITLFNLIPFVFIAGGVVWILKKVLS